MTVYWTICKRYGLRHSDKGYNHWPNAVSENYKGKLLWDFNIQTNKVIGAKRSDLMFGDREVKEFQYIDSYSR